MIGCGDPMQLDAQDRSERRRPCPSEAPEIVGDVAGIHDETEDVHRGDRGRERRDDQPEGGSRRGQTDLFLTLLTNHRTDQTDHGRAPTMTGRQLRHAPIGGLFSVADVGVDLGQVLFGPTRS